MKNMFMGVSIAAVATILTIQNAITLPTNRQVNMQSITIDIIHYNANAQLTHLRCITAQKCDNLCRGNSESWQPTFPKTSLSIIAAAKVFNSNITIRGTSFLLRYYNQSIDKMATLNSERDPHSLSRKYHYEKKMEIAEDNIL